jgi:two-component system, OmpR family, alkaline phosphatase synthesis response regulator PhoP
MMSNKKILIVDDDRDILETMQALLEYEGFEIRSAENVDKGIEMIDEYAPGVVLLDVMFPEKKTLGFEVAVRIKEKYPHLPIFMITAINREYSFNFSKDDIKADEFFNKPIDYDRLVKTIKKYIK